jgi:hypothetical protein
MPGVERASMAVGLPFGYRFGVPLRVPGIDEIPALESGGPSISAVAPDYFETVGTPIVRGRPFDARDGAGTEPVAIVSRTMADTVWPGLDPLGRCLVIGGNAGGGEGASVAPPCTRVVGVAGDTRRSRLRETPVMHYYIPAGQESGFGGAVLLVRPSDASGRIVPELRRWLTSVDPAIAYVSAETIQTRVDPQIQPWRQGASVFFLSGVLALIVTGMGLYSVMSYLIADRRREIGVRLALGAQHGDIVRLVLRASVGMAVVGIAIGEIATALAARWVAPYLFDTSARDPLVYTATAAVLVIVALGAALVPARRARAVNPIEALRAG